MTAPIVYDEFGGPVDAFDGDAALTNRLRADIEDGQLWQRIAEGKRRD